MGEIKGLEGESPTHPINSKPYFSAGEMYTAFHPLAGLYDGMNLHSSILFKQSCVPTFPSQKFFIFDGFEYSPPDSTWKSSFQPLDPNAQVSQPLGESWGLRVKKKWRIKVQNLKLYEFKIPVIQPYLHGIITSDITKKKICTKITVVKYSELTRATTVMKAC